MTAAGETFNDLAQIRAACEVDYRQAMDCDDVVQLRRIAAAVIGRTFAVLAMLEVSRAETAEVRADLREWAAACVGVGAVAKEMAQPITIEGEQP
jgi:hypothetical protein